jgi:hypothetical protein
MFQMVARDLTYNEILSKKDIGFNFVPLKNKKKNKFEKILGNSHPPFKQLAKRYGSYFIAILPCNS